MFNSLPLSINEQFEHLIVKKKRKDINELLKFKN